MLHQEGLHLYEPVAMVIPVEAAEVQGCRKAAGSAMASTRVHLMECACFFSLQTWANHADFAFDNPPGSTDAIPGSQSSMLPWTTHL